MLSTRVFICYFLFNSIIYKLDYKYILFITIIHQCNQCSDDPIQNVNNEMEGQPLGHFEYVDCKMRDNVGLLALNRGEKNNALSAQLRRELVQALKLLVAQGARCVRL